MGNMHYEFYIYQKLRCEKSALFQCYIYAQASLHPEWRKGEGGNLSYINPQCVPSNIYSQRRMTFLLAAEIKLSAEKIAFLFYQFLAWFQIETKGTIKYFPLIPEMQSKPVKAEGGCSADGALAPTAEEKQWAEHTLHFPGFQPKAVAQPQSQQPRSIPGASVTFPGLLRLRNRGPHHPREHRGSQTLLGTDAVYLGEFGSHHEPGAALRALLRWLWEWWCFVFISVWLMS